MPSVTSGASGTRTRRESFGRRLARLRKGRGLTQEELATLAGITRAMVATYESQGVSPPSKVLPQIAKALGASIDELFAHDAGAETDALPEAIKQRRDGRSASKRWKRKGQSADLFGSRLARLRREQGMTQREFGATVGISSRMVTYYEAQRGNPPLELLPKFAKALGVSIDALFGRERSEGTEPPRNSRLWRKLKRLEQLPERKRKALLRLVEEMLEETPADKG